jgi:hypothetical protein
MNTLTRKQKLRALLAILAVSVISYSVVLLLAETDCKLNTQDQPSRYTYTGGCEVMTDGTWQAYQSQRNQP